MQQTFFRFKTRYHGTTIRTLQRNEIVCVRVGTCPTACRDRYDGIISVAFLWEQPPHGVPCNPRHRIQNLAVATAVLPLITLASHKHARFCGQKVKDGEGEVVGYPGNGQQELRLVLYGSYNSVF